MDIHEERNASLHFIFKKDKLFLLRLRLLDSRVRHNHFCKRRGRFRDVHSVGTV